MDNTKIEWTTSTWNALRGCSPVSAGCANCYAAGLARRFSKPGQWGHGLAEKTPGGPRWTGKVVLDEKALLKPLHWKNPRLIFVTSIGDPFHETVSDGMLDRLFAVMALCPQHTFQLLTKRPERMREYLLRTYELTGPVWIANHMRERPLKDGSHAIRQVRQPTPLPNLWLGVSVENQDAADTRIPDLLATPAAKRFISAEPLLGPVDVRWALFCNRLDIAAGILRRGHFAPGLETLRPLDWVIVGGESGPKARPMHPDWARSLRDWCAVAGVPFMFKQWGEWAPYDRGIINSQELATPGSTDTPMQRVGKKAAGRLLDGVEHLQIP